MIYTLENTSDAGRPVRVFDATGKEWTEVVACDTETGCIKKHLVIHGFAQVDPFSSRAITQILYIPAPLTVTPCKEGDPPYEVPKVRTFGCICVQDEKNLDCLACKTESDFFFSGLRQLKGDL
jgi:hypothetical protein